MNAKQKYLLQNEIELVNNYESVNNCELSNLDVKVINAMRGRGYSIVELISLTKKEKENILEFGEKNIDLAIESEDIYQQQEEEDDKKDWDEHYPLNISESNNL